MTDKYLYIRKHKLTCFIYFKIIYNQGSSSQLFSFSKNLSLLIVNCIELGMQDMY